MVDADSKNIVVTVLISVKQQSQNVMEWIRTPENVDQLQCRDSEAPDSTCPRGNSKITQEAEEETSSRDQNREQKKGTGGE